MSPVHIEDVADAFVAALEDDATIGKIIELAGPEVLTWRDMIERIAGAAGRRKIIMPMPLGIMRAGATALDWLPFYPVTRDQLIMLEEGNTGSSEVLEKLIVRQARSLSVAELQYLAR